MKIRTTLRSIVIDIYELVQELPEDGVRTLADALAVRDEVIKQVAQQILGDWTDLDSRAALSCEAHAEPRTGLDWAMREVAKRSSEVARDEIKRLESSLERSEARRAELERHLYRWEHQNFYTPDDGE